MVKTLTLLSYQENQKVDALIKAAENEPIIFTQESQDGQRYAIDFKLVTEQGSSH